MIATTSGLNNFPQSFWAYICLLREKSHCFKGSDHIFLLCKTYPMFRVLQRHQIKANQMKLENHSKSADTTKAD